ncbi:MAG: type I methionyl aminopeptidase [Rickettsiales bacterium]|jgi:methionyl aminopeptidase|nr:type I methionyl aminopeptidase [Rickettsiales bacterium]
MAISIYTDEDFAGIRAAGRKASATLDHISDFIAPGVSTYDLDRIVAEHTKKLGGICAPLNFEGYPKSCCISRNDVICHGIPSKREFVEDGDMLNIDVTTIFNGYFGDTSRMFFAGRASDRARELADAAREALLRAIAICAPGVSFARIGRVVEEVARAHGFSIVREYCGHGIGTAFHEDPNVLHYYSRESEKLIMREGMVFTIEPMLNLGAPDVRLDRDGWTARTADGGLSAQWEHTIGITPSGAEIFTVSD